MQGAQRAHRRSSAVQTNVTGSQARDGVQTLRNMIAREEGLTGKELHGRRRRLLADEAVAQVGLRKTKRSLPASAVIWPGLLNSVLFLICLGPCSLLVLIPVPVPLPVDVPVLLLSPISMQSHLDRPADGGAEEGGRGGPAGSGSEAAGRPARSCPCRRRCPATTPACTGDTQQSYSFSSNTSALLLDADGVPCQQCSQAIAAAATVLSQHSVRACETKSHMSGPQLPSFSPSPWSTWKRHHFGIRMPITDPGLCHRLGRHVACASKALIYILPYRSPSFF